MNDSTVWLNTQSWSILINMGQWQEINVNMRLADTEIQASISVVCFRMAARRDVQLRRTSLGLVREGVWWAARWHRGQAWCLFHVGLMSAMLAAVRWLPVNEHLGTAPCLHDISGSKFRCTDGKECGMIEGKDRICDGKPPRSCRLWYITSEAKPKRLCTIIYSSKEVFSLILHPLSIVEQEIVIYPSLNEKFRWFSKIVFHWDNVGFEPTRVHIQHWPHS